MNRRLIVAGNWKMNCTLSVAASLAESVVKSIEGGREVDVVLCPPFTALDVVADIIQDSSVGLGAQNVHWEIKGAFTGEVSIPMLLDVGCRYCIIGHSERRQLFGETDEMVQKKLQALLNQGMQAIVCVGETLDVRKAGRTWDVIKSQLEAVFRDIHFPQLGNQVILAYEPIWAIGTGQNATSAQAQEVHGAIRSWLTDRFGKLNTGSIRIQYGGSVNPENAQELMSQSDIDGVLVGGASLDSKAFTAIIQAAIEAKRVKCFTV